MFVRLSQALCVLELVLSHICVVILSKSQNIEIRNVQRTIFSKDYGLDTQLTYRFVSNNPEDVDLRSLILNESKVHNDYWINTHSSEAYENLPNQTMYGFHRFIFEFKDNPCTLFVKTDDDTFISLKRLNFELVHRFPQKQPTYMLDKIVFGYYVEGAPVHRSGKWKVSESVYPEKHYPPYIQGPTYALTPHMVFMLLASFLKFDIQSSYDSTSSFLVKLKNDDSLIGLGSPKLHLEDISMALSGHEFNKNLKNIRKNSNSEVVALMSNPVQFIKNEKFNGIYSCSPNKLNQVIAPWGSQPSAVGGGFRGVLDVPQGLMEFARLEWMGPQKIENPLRYIKGSNQSNEQQLLTDAGLSMFNPFCPKPLLQHHLWLVKAIQSLKQSLVSFLNSLNNCIDWRDKKRITHYIESIKISKSLLPLKYSKGDSELVCGEPASNTAIQFEKVKKSMAHAIRMSSFSDWYISLDETLPLDPPNYNSVFGIENFEGLIQQRTPIFFITLLGFLIDVSKKISLNSVDSSKFANHAVSAFWKTYFEDVSAGGSLLKRNLRLILIDGQLPEDLASNPSSSTHELKLWPLWDRIFPSLNNVSNPFSSKLPLVVYADPHVIEWNHYMLSLKHLKHIEHMHDYYLSVLSNLHPAAAPVQSTLVNRTKSTPSTLVDLGWMCMRPCLVSSDVSLAPHASLILIPHDEEFFKGRFPKTHQNLVAVPRASGGGNVPTAAMLRETLGRANSQALSRYAHMITYEPSAESVRRHPRFKSLMSSLSMSHLFNSLPHSNGSLTPLSYMEEPPQAFLSAVAMADANRRARAVGRLNSISHSSLTKDTENIGGGASYPEEVQQFPLWGWPLFEPDFPEMISFVSRNCARNRNQPGSNEQSDLRDKRSDFVKKLSKRVSLASYGKCVHNKDWPKNHLGDKKYVSERHPFCLAIENNPSPWYHTEKLWDCLKSGAITIYYGHLGTGQFIAPDPEGIIWLEGLEEQDLNILVARLQDKDYLQKVAAHARLSHRISHIVHKWINSTDLLSPPKSEFASSHAVLDAMLNPIGAALGSHWNNLHTSTANQQLHDWILWMDAEYSNDRAACRVCESAWKLADDFDRKKTDNADLPRSTQVRDEL